MEVKVGADQVRFLSEAAMEVDSMSCEPDGDVVEDEEVLGALDAAADLERRHRDRHAREGREQRGVRTVA